MRVNPITNYNQKQNCNGKSTLAFGSFIKVQMYDGFIGSAFYTRKNIVHQSVKDITDLVKSLKLIVG